MVFLFNFDTDSYCLLKKKSLYYSNNELKMNIFVSNY
jgi:hypothetical protein